MRRSHEGKWGSGATVKDRKIASPMKGALFSRRHLHHLCAHLTLFSAPGNVASNSRRVALPVSAKQVGLCERVCVRVRKLPSLSKLAAEAGRTVCVCARV